MIALDEAVERERLRDWRRETLEGEAPLIVFDIDSTLWDLTPWLSEYLEGLSHEDIATWTYLFDHYGDEAAGAAFAAVLEPRRVRDRHFYPGAKDAIKGVQEAGFRVAFLSHNPYPAQIEPYVRVWLYEHLGFDIGAACVLHSSVPKLDVLRTWGAYGVVDDKPETLEAAADAGMFAATLIQPWNRELVKDRPDVFGFERWEQFNEILTGVFK